jgi:hypothetical protein
MILIWRSNFSKAESANLWQANPGRSKSWLQSPESGLSVHQLLLPRSGIFTTSKTRINLQNGSVWHLPFTNPQM